MNNGVEQYRSTISKAFYAMALLYWFWLFVSDCLLHQWHAPGLVGPRMDYTYWVLILSGLADLLVQNNVIAGGFDLIWLACIIGAILLRRYRVFNIGVAICTCLHFMLFNIYSTAHFNTMAMAFMSLLFVFPSDTSFRNMFEGLRYYLLFVFVTAACWKIFRGNLWYADQLSNILKTQVLDFMVLHPDSWRSSFFQFLILHKAVAHSLWVGIITLELAFIVGVFTKRYDGVLIGLALLFNIGSYFITNINNFELLPFYLLLIPWDRIGR